MPSFSCFSKPRGRFLVWFSICLAITPSARWTARFLTFQPRSSPPCRPGPAGPQLARSRLLSPFLLQLSSLPFPRAACHLQGVTPHLPRPLCSITNGPAGMLCFDFWTILRTKQEKGRRRPRGRSGPPNSSCDVTLPLLLAAMVLQLPEHPSGNSEKCPTHLGAASRAPPRTSHRESTQW